jgi:hypothetical protein
MSIIVDGRIIRRLVFSRSPFEGLLVPGFLSLAKYASPSFRGWPWYGFLNGLGAIEDPGRDGNAIV